MDKNKKHTDASDFFRMLNTDPTDQQKEELDDFDLEALEGLRMVKNPQGAKAKADANIDKKLEELIAEDREDKAVVVIGDEAPRRKTGLYVLSIAASLVLLFGLFFLFRGVSEDDKHTGVADISTSDKKEIGIADSIKMVDPLEEKAKETNSDRQVVVERNGYVANNGIAYNYSPAASSFSKTESNNAPGTYWSSDPKSDSTRLHLEKPVASGSYTVNVNDCNGCVTAQKNNLSQTTMNEVKADDFVALKSEAEKSNKADQKLSNKKYVATEYDEADKATYKKQDDLDLSDATLRKEEQVSTKVADAKRKDTVKSRSALKDKEGKKAEENRNKDAETYAAASPPAEELKEPYRTSLDSVSINPQIAANTTTAKSPVPNANTGGVSYTWTAPANAATVSGNTSSFTLNSSNGAGIATIPVIEPEFTGGKKALDAYIKKNLVVPASCVSEEVIVVKFLVSEKGIVSKPKIVSKTGHCKDCETEALRFVKAMPAWVAATQGGKAVSSHKTIVLSFKK